MQHRTRKGACFLQRHPPLCAAVTVEAAGRPEGGAWCGWNLPAATTWLTPGSPAPVTGSVRASGTIWCTRMHQTLPGTRILPENGAVGASEVWEHAGITCGRDCRGRSRTGAARTGADRTSCPSGVTADADEYGNQSGRADQGDLRLGSGGSLPCWQAPAQWHPSRTARRADPYAPRCSLTEVLLVLST